MNQFNKELFPGLGTRTFSMETTRPDKYGESVKYNITHYEGTILKCIKCGDTSTPLQPCNNCGTLKGLSIYHEGADTILRCFPCELKHHQTRWTCKKCGCGNPIGKSAFHWSEITGPVREGCFIATVCYGSYEASEVVALRTYRDNHLLRTRYGKIFVAIYYHISPFFARLISKSDFLKKRIRKYFLTPLVKKITNAIKI